MSFLFSGSPHGLEYELPSPDRIDLLCSFIKLCGLDRFRPLIERHRTEASTRRLIRALSEPERTGDFFAFDLEPKDWQKPILRELAEARATAGRRTSSSPRRKDAHRGLRPCRPPA